ncbi:Cytochrome c oxidase polypeptide 5, mitochondrial [Phlyctema vagabunda]|uniref:Cytochrome c oxidase polypeptide 5, mitochondrial n=1 Tax=Phlyctema vagabunda TaxID=108571 RepID=A0ABR4PD80_9HELO
MLRNSILRSSRAAIVRQPAVAAQLQVVQRRQAHAISNPTLANIEKRWESMPPQEQADLWMALRDRMKVNWAELTLQEKKAAYWIAFGAHGPRALTPPGEGWKVFGLTMAGVGVSFAVFVLIRAFAKGSPATMTKEYQEATNEYLLVSLYPSPSPSLGLQLESQGPLPGINVLTVNAYTGSKLRAHQRYLIRGICRQGICPERAPEEGIDGPGSQAVSQTTTTRPSYIGKREARWRDGDKEKDFFCYCFQRGKMGLFFCAYWVARHQSRELEYECNSVKAGIVIEGNCTKITSFLSSSVGVLLLFLLYAAACVLDELQEVGRVYIPV